MWEWLSRLADPSDFPARWVCGNWSDLHGWIHITADIMTWAAYTAIPCTLAYFIARRKDLVFPRVFWLFCLFIFSCGTVHFVDAVLFWYPVYRISATVKVITAVASWASLIALWQVTPKALALPGLAIVNQQLKNEIAERKKISEELHKSQDRLNLALQSSNAGVWLRDLKTNQLFWDQTIYRMFDFDVHHEPVTYDQFINCIHPDDQERIQQRIKESIDDQKPYFCDYRILKNDGSVRHVHSTGTVYYDEQQEPSLFTGISSDITEKKRLDEQKRALEEKFQQAQKLESLGLMAGGIAHDFNNLLVGVLGNASLASSKLSDEFTPHEIKVHLNQIESAAVRASELTKQMLAYSGKGKVQIDPFDLNQLIFENLNLIKATISKNADFQMNLSQSLPMIEGDRSQLAQVLMNLITNASDALEERSGTITVFTSVQYCDHCFLNSTFLPKEQKEGEYVCLKITDNGIGIQPAAIEKIFDPFYSTKFVGRGLGLAAVLGIVHGHHGVIKVESEIGVGTTFSLFFPVYESLKTTSSAFLESEIMGTNKGKVLFVDDEGVIHIVLKALLKHIGFESIAANDGEKALELYKKHQSDIDLVILDLTMPGMSGEEVFDELRRFNPDLKIIISSGYSEKDVVERFAGKKMTGFIQKPYTVDGLKDIFSKIYRVR